MTRPRFKNSYKIIDLEIYMTRKFLRLPSRTKKILLTQLKMKNIISYFKNLKISLEMIFQLYTQKIQLKGNFNLIQARKLKKTI